MYNPLSLIKALITASLPTFSSKEVSTDLKSLISIPRFCISSNAENIKSFSFLLLAKSILLLGEASLIPSVSASSSLFKLLNNSCEFCLRFLTVLDLTSKLLLISSKVFLRVSTSFSNSFAFSGKEVSNCSLPPESLL